MNQDTRLHVFPSAGRWAVRQAGAQRSSKVFERRPEAIAWVKARTPAVLFIHGHDGRITQRLVA